MNPSPRSPTPTFTCPEFVELLGRSHFSFLQGTSSPEEMTVRARALGYRGFALCDLNGLYGVVRGFQAMEFPSQFVQDDASLHASAHPDFAYYIGSEMQMSDGSSVVLMPLHKEGYTNLCQIITQSKRGSPKGFSNLNMEILSRYSDDLLAFALPPWNLEKLVELREIFEDRLYLPVWKDLTWESLELYRQALTLESSHQFELFVTQRPLMATRQQKPLHDVLTCILHKTTLKKAKTRLLSNGERHLKPLHELLSVWQDRPDLLSKTAQIARRIRFSLKELHYEYPQAARPAGIDASDYLRQLVERGTQIRFPEGVTSKVRGMIEHELALIHDLAYEDYFLTLYDVCQFATTRGILHQGRGSAANSIVCYCLGLTAVDPSQIELLFERFISKERGEPPDIDIDFESGRREEVIQYIYEKYGSDHAAMVCTVICYRGRMALRECAKVLDIPLATINQMIRYMGREGTARLNAASDKRQRWSIDERTFSLLVQMANALKGLPRHLGIHTGGFLIAKRPITECVPVEKATMDKRFVIQWNKDDLTTLRMLKVDVLGLGMLTALQKCFDMLRRDRGVSMNLYNVPTEDKPTYDMIQKADTVGVFQIESRAQMSLLPRLKPKCFYDLVIEVAIVRPGPIQGGMIHPFIRRRHGQEKVEYPHEDLRPILEKTCGVPIFQEQIMQIASKVGGFTPGEADELRRIMSSSWKKHDLMHGLRQRLISGMLSHGIALQYAEQIYQTIVGFASYGFPESHAASFALLTYASCYIKKHHPDVFVCALLNSQPMGFYSPRSLILDAQRHHVEFLPLDVQHSDYDYRLEGSQVRAGFRAIYGLKERDVEVLVGARRQQGPFCNLRDLIERTQLRKNVLMRIAAAGALTSLGLTPREALWKLQALSLDPQDLFFARESGAEAETALLSQENDWACMNREYRSQGYSLQHHPLRILRPELNQRAFWNRQGSMGLPFLTAEQLSQHKNGTRVRVAGLLSMQQRPPTAKGFAFLTLEDETGLINVVLLPHVYQRFRILLLENPLLDLVGTLESVEGVINIKAQDIRSMPSSLADSSAAQFDFTSCLDDHTIA